MTVNQLCKEYANYLRFDSSSNVKAVEDNIDETLTRLEEFETLLAMVRSDNEFHLASSVLARKEALLEICEKIRYLEDIVYKVKQSVDAMENCVITAESELKGSSETGGFLSLVKPLFFRKSDSSNARNAAASSSSSNEVKTFTPPTVFSSSQFFVPQNLPS